MRSLQQRRVKRAMQEGIPQPHCRAIIVKATGLSCYAGQEVASSKSSTFLHLLMSMLTWTQQVMLLLMLTLGT